MKTHFLKLTDAHTGKPMLVRADDIGAVCDGHDSHQVKGARLHVRGSVLVSMESVEEIEKMLAEWISLNKRLSDLDAEAKVGQAAEILRGIATVRGEPQTH